MPYKLTIHKSGSDQEHSLGIHESFEEAFDVAINVAENLGTPNNELTLIPHTDKASNDFAIRVPGMSLLVRVFKV
jgi:hypothetical protein